MHVTALIEMAMCIWKRMMTLIRRKMNRKMMQRSKMRRRIWMRMMAKTLGRLARE
jgi:hypothetical protein